MPAIVPSACRRYASLGALAIASAAIALVAGEEAPWPAPVPGHVAVQPGEHPRLLFRKSDLPRLRERAKTPEGQAIIARIRKCLNGGDGESMTDKFGVKGKVSSDGAGEFDKAPEGLYTFSHTAGFGFLYQITGDRKYADLGRKAMDKAFEEYRDRDRRYSFKYPFGALRAGPSLGWTVLGYDLCYDGWDEDYRKKVALAIQDYNEGQWMSLAELVRGARQHPGSNHWGMQVGGGALAVLAIMNDPGVDMGRIGPLLETSKQSMITNMTKGFGDGGFFAEGDGTGSMASHISFLPALQAWKVAGGQDFITPRQNAQWLTLKWFLLTIPRGGKMDFPQRGGYPHNIWARNDISGAGYFAIGFGAVPEEQRPGILWFYNHHMKAIDDKAGTPFDTPTPYCHLHIISFVNWPFGMPEKNPAEVFPRACVDSKWGFFMCRNRWKDENDIVISALGRSAKGNMGAGAEKGLTVWAHGKKGTWGTFTGGFKEWTLGADGSAILPLAGGSGCLAIDFSGASGADGMLVLAGPGAGPGTTVKAGGNDLTIHFLSAGAAPTPKAEGDQVVVGTQTIAMKDGRIVLGTFTPTAK